MELTDPTPSPRSLWQELRDAIRGTGADYTKIPLRRAVFLLAVPMVLELVLESTFAVVDIWFVARLGASAVATARAGARRPAGARKVRRPGRADTFDRGSRAAHCR